MDISFDGGRTSDAYLVLPDGAAPGSLAGIIWFHWLEPSAPNSNRTEFLDEARALAARGVASLLVQGIFPWQDQPQSLEHDRAALEAELTMLRRARDLLSAQPQVDRQRLALVGHDFGAMYSAVLFGEDQSFKALVMMTPTARWSDWFLRYWSIAGDPQTYSAGLADLDPVTALGGADGRPVLLQVGDSDQFVPSDVATEIATAAGAGAEQHTYQAGHALNETATQQRDDWLAGILGLGAGADAPVNVGNGPIGLVQTDGAIWVAVYWEGQLVELDPQTRAIVASVVVGTGAIGVALGAGSIWVTVHETNQVVRIDPATRAVMARIDVPEHPEGIAADDDAVWVSSEGTGQLLRIDPATNQVVATVAVGDEPRHIGLGFGSVWVTNYGSGSVTRVNPSTNKVLKTIKADAGTEGICFAAGSVWVANVDGGTVTRIDPATNKVVDTFRGGAFNEGLAADGDQVWLAITGANKVAPIDTTTDSIGAGITVGQSPRRILLRPGELWVTNTDAGTISVIPRS